MDPERYCRTYVRALPHRPSVLPRGADDPGGDRARESLALLAERTRPVSSSRTRLLPVLPPWPACSPTAACAGAAPSRSTACPGGSGSGSGDVSLALALVAAASGAGSWCGLIGLTGLGAVAAHDIGIDLGRLALVPRPGAAWAEVTATMIDGVDLVVLCPPSLPAGPWPGGWWPGPGSAGRSWWWCPDGPDGPSAPTCSWGSATSAGRVSARGAGYLRQRRMTVTATGRRSAARPLRRHLWLPAATGTVADGSPAAARVPS